MIPNELDPARVEQALRRLIADIDYDTHKSLECDEETGLDGYPDLAEQFIELHNHYETSN